MHTYVNGLSQLSSKNGYVYQTIFQRTINCKSYKLKRTVKFHVTFLLLAWLFSDMIN